MTICIAIRCWKEIGKKRIQAVLFASDTQESYAGLKLRVNKVRRVTPQNQPPVYVAGDGDGSLVDEFAYALEDEFEELTRQLSRSRHRLDRDLMKEGISELLWTGRRNIADLAHEIYKNQVERTPDDDDPIFSCLVGTSNPSGETEVVLFDCSGRFSRIKDFYAIGSGAFNGGLLLLSQLYSPNMNTKQAMRLAAYVIEQVGSIDAYVSGLDFMKLSYLGKAEDIKGEDYEAIVREAREFHEAYKRSWSSR